MAYSRQRQPKGVGRQANASRTEFKSLIRATVVTTVVAYWTGHTAIIDY